MGWYERRDELDPGDAVLQDRWTKEERLDYFRCIAICSAYWQETP